MFERDWIKRLWTYQEVMLSNNPVVVCGDAHIPWRQFEKSVMFLSESMLHGYDDIALVWKQVALSRDQLGQKHQTAISQPEQQTELQLYRDFLTKSARYFFLIRNWARGPWAMFLIPVIVLAVMLYSGAYETYPLQLLIPWAIFLALCLTSFWEFVRGLFVLYTAGWSRIPEPLQHDFINDLYNRTAREPKDMAFGAWAILQRHAECAMVTPNYRQSQAAIYKIFTQYLVQTTESPQFLLYAAVQNAPEAPSWVPDWSARSRQTWGDSAAILEDNFSWLRNPWGVWLPTHLPFASGKEMVHIKPGSEAMALTVRARQLYVIIQHFCFQECSGDVDADRGNHVENIRLMLLLVQSHRAHPYPRGLPGTRRLWSEFPDHLLDTFSTFGSSVDRSILESIERKDLNHWTNFLRSNKTNSPAQVLALLRSGESMVYWSYSGKHTVVYADILRTHVAFCNHLARQDKVIFQAARPETSENFRAGICSRQVRVDDHVFEVMGVPSRLILRCVPGKEDAFSLVSLAITQHVCWFSSEGYTAIDDWDPGVHKPIDIY